MRLQIGAPLRSAAQRSDPPGSRGGSGHSSGVPIAPNGSRAHCKEAIMAQIGSFTREDNGIYTGEIRTLTLRVKATIRPVEREHDKEPDHRSAERRVGKE